MSSEPMPIDAEVVDRELEQRLEHLGIAMDRTRGDDIDPPTDGGLVVPPQALPAEHAEAAGQPDRPGRMTLHQRGVERAGHDHEVPLRAGRPVEHQPLVGAVGAAQDPARQPVGEAADGRQGLLAHGNPGDVELRPRPPGRRIRHRFHDRPAARGAPLVNHRPQRTIDLVEQHVTLGRVLAEAHAGLFQLFRQASSSPISGLRHRA